MKTGDIVYLVRASITDGIRTGTVAHVLQGNCVLLADHPKGIYEVGVDVFVDADAAVKGAEKMRSNRIRALKKEIADLEKLSFQAP